MNNHMEFNVNNLVWTRAPKDCSIKEKKSESLPSPVRICGSGPITDSAMTMRLFFR